MNSLTEKITPNISVFEDYSNKKFLKSTTDFLNSNSLVAKISFLILIIFLFIVILRIGISILNDSFIDKDNVTLIDGMIPGENLVVISQNPNVSNSKPVMRSKNENDGLEFTWSSWLWLKQPPLSNDPSARPNLYKHIFNKGNDIIDSDGIVKPNNCPGLYISPNGKDLVVIMNTFDSIKEEIVIPNIPIEKWINVIIRCNQLNLDVFINGTVIQSYKFNSVPKQNYDNIYVGLNGGFNGNLSRLQYFAHSIGTNKIQSIIEKGPNLKNINDKHIKTKPYYLSFRWFFPDKPTLS